MLGLVVLFASLTIHFCYKLKQQKRERQTQDAENGKKCCNSSCNNTEVISHLKDVIININSTMIANNTEFCRSVKLLLTHVEHARPNPVSLPTALEYRRVADDGDELCSSPSPPPCYEDVHECQLAEAIDEMLQHWNKITTTSEHAQLQ